MRPNKKKIMKPTMKSTNNSTSKKLFTCVVPFLLAVIHLNSYSLDFVEEYNKATRYDPTYLTALADQRGNLAAANQAWTAYTPTASYTTQRQFTETGPTGTLTVSQPIIDYAALASLREAQPRKGFAESTFITKQQDLATRLFKAADAIILANENLKLNDSKIRALELQYFAAKRKYELGQGTITDQRDIEVKAAQAKSQQITNKSQLMVAAKQYAAITGETPNVAEFVLPAKHNSFDLKPVEDYIDLALQNNPSIIAARYSERVAELEVQKSYGAFMPTFSVALSDIKTGGNTQHSVYGLVNLPLQAGTYFAIQGVAASYQKSKEATRDVEEKTKVDVQRLRAQLEAGFESLAIQQDAIKSAELSVEANIKSYEGGVRTTVDVLNATQTVFQVKSDYVTSVTTQAENYLALILNSTLNSNDALRLSFNYLFAR